MASAGGEVVFVDKPMAVVRRKHFFRRPVFAAPNTQVLDSWLCILCRGILILTFQTDCGCRFCELCLADLENESSERSCPDGFERCGPFALKGPKETRPKPDLAVRRQVAKVPVLCPNKCGTTIRVEDLMKHLKICLFQCCPHCLSIAEREHFKDHEDKVCQDCQEIVPKCQFVSKHLNPMSPKFCKNFSGPCPYCCKTVINSNDLQRHRLFCNKWPQLCTYEVLGCPGNHEKCSANEVSLHLSCLVKKFMTKKVVESSNFRMETEESFRKCQEVNVKMDKLEEAKHQDDDLTKRMENVQEEVDKARKKIERNHDILLRLNSVDTIVQQPVSFPVVPYIWKIPNFLELKKRESVVDSLPFLSDLYKYKMRVRLYVSGDGQGRGTHLSAYIILMSYDYDNLLDWPFRLPFLFTLRDQSNKGQDYQQLINPNPKSRSFTRPPATEGASSTVRASGCAKFFPLERLTSNSIYLLDGSLYLTVDVLKRPDRLE